MVPFQAVELITRAEGVRTAPSARCPCGPCRHDVSGQLPLNYGRGTLGLLTGTPRLQPRTFTISRAKSTLLAEKFLSDKASCFPDP